MEKNLFGGDKKKLDKVNKESKIVIRLISFF